MRFLITPFLVYIGISVSLLFWWRPAPELLSVKTVDWAMEYEKEHTPAPDKHLWGAMEMAREFIRSSAPHHPLTEFIEIKTRDQLIRGNSHIWQKWYEDNFTKKLTPADNHSYFSPDNPPLDLLKKLNGYIEIRIKNTIRFLSYNRLDTRDMEKRDIPTSLKYPLRSAAITLFLSTMTIWGIKRTRKKKYDRVSGCTAGTGCRFFLGVLTTGLALLALPFFYYDGEGGFWALFIGILVFVVGMVGLAFFGVQIAAVRRMMNGEDCLAHWTYTPLEWGTFVKLEMEAQSEAKWGLLGFISIIIVVVGAGFWLVMQDTASLWVFLFLLGLIVLLWAVVLLTQKLAGKRLKQTPGEVFLGASSVYVNGMVHSWNLIGSRFESIKKINDPFPMLEIVYSYLMVTGNTLYFFRQYATVRVPIPEKKETEATAIIQRYN